MFLQILFAMALALAPLASVGKIVGQDHDGHTDARVVVAVVHPVESVRVFGDYRMLHFPGLLGRIERLLLCGLVDFTLLVSSLLVLGALLLGRNLILMVQFLSLVIDGGQNALLHGGMRNVATFEAFFPEE